MINIYTVQCNSDMTEGRGGMRDIISFTSEDEAWEYTEGKSGVMGRKPQSGSWRNEKYGDWTVKVLEVWEKGEYDPKEVQRKNALAKLTKDERKILGLV
jgi:hypothetical protein